MPAPLWRPRFRTRGGWGTEDEAGVVRLRVDRWLLLSSSAMSERTESLRYAKTRLPNEPSHCWEFGTPEEGRQRQLSLGLYPASLHQEQTRSDLPEDELDEA